MALTGCQPAGPESQVVRQYLEHQLPPYLSISDIGTKSFMDGNTGTGRTSVTLTVVCTEPLYRQASGNEIESILASHNLTVADLGANARLMVVLAHAKDSTVRQEFELESRETVNGWQFGGGFDLSHLQGIPRSNLRPDVIVPDTDEERRYFQNLSARKQRLADQKSKFISWIRQYFASGQQHDGAHRTGNAGDMTYPYRFSIRFTRDPIVREEANNFIAFEAFGALEWKKDYNLTFWNGRAPQRLANLDNVYLKAERISIWPNGKWVGSMSMTFGPTGKEYNISPFGNYCQITEGGFIPDAFLLEPAVKTQ
jgi:hypothetical protein